MSKQHDRKAIEALLARREDEGLTYGELSEQSGIPKSTLSGWAYRLRKEGLEEAAPVFVEVAVPGGADETPVEVVIEDRLHVLVWSGFDSATLRAVVSALS